MDDLDEPYLTDDDFHHFNRVLRVGHGELITIGDGAGRWRVARFDRRPAPQGEIGHIVASANPLTVAFSPVRGERAEWIVAKLTELGIDEIIPVLTERTVVRWDAARAAKQHARMANTGREACLQSRRLHLPTIRPLTTLAQLLAEHGHGVLADPDGRPMNDQDRVIVVGPEGGFTATERAMAPTIALPGNILRSETAALVAAGLACSLRVEVGGRE